MNDLELDRVGVVEEHRVVARRIAVLLGPALDRHPLLGHPTRPLVDDSTRLGGKRDVVDANRVGGKRRRMGV